jgi:hypothetical protein
METHVFNANHLDPLITLREVASVIGRSVRQVWRVCLNRTWRNIWNNCANCAMRKQTMSGNNL